MESSVTCPLACIAARCGSIGQDSPNFRGIEKKRNVIVPGFPAQYLVKFIFLEHKTLFYIKVTTLRAVDDECHA